MPAPLTAVDLLPLDLRDALVLINDEEVNTDLINSRLPLCLADRHPVPSSAVTRPGGRAGTGRLRAPLLRDVAAVHLHA
jgi:hypothetical protein